MVRVRLKGIVSWCLYDWANSAFPTIITTFIFATYFTEKVAVNKVIGTAQWGNAISLSALFIAILGPFIGAIADNEGRRKPWVALFTVITIISAAMLWYAKPEPSYVFWALIWLVVGETGLEVGSVFYNAMLEDLVPKKYIGRMSGWAWGIGYFGGLSALLICLVVFIKGHHFGLHLNKQLEEPIRICSPFVAVWFFVFSIPFFIWTKDKPSSGIGLVLAMKKGLSSLVHTCRSIRQYKEVVKFLIARMIYIDGLNTVFAFGGIYAAGVFHMNFSQVVEFGIAMNVAAGLGAVGFAWLDDLIGSKPTLLIALFILIISTTAVLLVHSVTLFWVFGMLLSVCVGPVQAASRSMLIHLAPRELIAEMFGLYALSGKATAFLGPLFLGWVTYWFDSQRAGMSTVLLFFVIGGILLFFVNESKKEA